MIYSRRNRRYSSVFGRPLASVVYCAAILLVRWKEREQEAALVASREVMEPAMRAVCRANEESSESDMISYVRVCVCVHRLLPVAPLSESLLLTRDPCAGSYLVLSFNHLKRRTRRSETAQFVRQIDSKRAADLMSARRSGLGSRPRSI